VGPAAHGRYDVWCEACQRAVVRATAPRVGDVCKRCGAPLAESPRFVELWGELQHLDAVLGAWAGEPGALLTILPERPRFLSDLDPPAASASDPPERVAALAALARGEWRAVLRHASDSDVRALAACAIASERLGDTTTAIAAWGRVLAIAEDPRARLARGALRARAGSLDEAEEDLVLAGLSFEARWNRAACLLTRAVRDRDAVPPADVLVRARAEAGEPSAYWSDPTVGRLLWSLLIERRLDGGRQAPKPLVERDRTTLRDAESEFEHDTFWDRAMILAGWSRLGALDDAARIAAPLAREQAEALLAEPALRAQPLRSVAEAVTEARTRIDRREPAAGRAALAPALVREDLRRFRIPCASCGRGTIGVEETAEIDGLR
jgi:hypothetical protein